MGAHHEYDKEMYKWRHRIENFLQKVKDYRGIATRCCKTDGSFQAFLSLAGTVLWISCGSNECQQTPACRKSTCAGYTVFPKEQALRANHHKIWNGIIHVIAHGMQWTDGSSCTTITSAAP